MNAEVRSKRASPPWCRVGIAVLALGCACAHADTLLVVRKSADALDFVDPGSGMTLASVAVGHGPHEVSRSPDGRLAAVTNYGTRERPGSTLSIIDLEYPRELRRIDLGEHRRPHGVVWYAETRIAVTSEASRSLLIVDPRAAAVQAHVDTGQDGSHLLVVTPDASRAFVANLGSGTTTVIDLAAGRKLGDIATGRGSEAIAITPDGNEVWVAAREAETITVLDARTLELLATLPMAGRPIRIAITPSGTALVSCAASSEIVAVDVRSRRELARRRIDLPPGESVASRAGPGPASGGAVPVGLLLSEDATAVYTAATRLDKVVRLALPGLEVVRAIDVAGEPDGMARTSLQPKSACHACEAPVDPYAPDPNQ